ncbi:hypothetical protein IKG06_02470 [Candidatus Saccharibacteria bacterium]|nr:hypothetical protein [Candidatus Saccharibacteria bacterium]
MNYCAEECEYVGCPYNKIHADDESEALFLGSDVFPQCARRSKKEEDDHFTYYELFLDPNRYGRKE